MKVKNIMFSGVMGVILMSVASSANAAISVASKAYVDTKASSVEAAYKEADTELATAINTEKSAREAAVGALDTRVTQNTDDIAAVKQLTGTEGVADQIDAAKTELTTAINKKVDQTAYDTKVGELEDADEALDGKITAMDTAYKAADTTLDGKISANTAAIATKVAQSDYNTKVAALEQADADNLAEAKSYADGLNTTASEAIAKKVDTVTYEAKVAELAGAITSGDASTLSDAKAYADGLADNYDAAGSAATAKSEAIAEAKSYADGLADNYDAAGSAAQALTDAKSYADGLATNYDAAGSAATAKSEAIAALDAYKESNNAAVAAKVAQSVYDAKVAELVAADSTLDGKITANTNAIATKVDQSDYDAKVLQIENALGTKIEMPAECATTDCVLAINKASGTISWTPLTEPVEDFINQQN